MTHEYHISSEVGEQSDPLDGFDMPEHLSDKPEFQDQSPSIGLEQKPVAEDIMAVDGITRFIDKAAEKELLTKKEEVDLAKRIERGDLEALKELVERNILLVTKVAGKYNSPYHGARILFRKAF